MSSLEEIEKELYKRDGRVVSLKKESPPRPSPSPKIEFGAEWGKPPPPEKPPTIITAPRFFIFFRKLKTIAAAGLILILIGALAYIGARYFLKGPAVELVLSGPTEVNAGETYTYDILLRNQSRAPLSEILISAEFENGVYSERSPGDKIFVEELKGEVPVEASRKETLKLFFLGKKNDTREVRISARYRVGGSQGRFEKKTALPVKIVNEAISLDLNLPNRVIRGEVFGGSLRFQSRLEEALANGQVRIDFPEDFSLHGSNPSPKEKNLWELGTISKSGGEISWRGILAAPEGQSRPFRATIGVLARGNFVPLAETSFDVTAIPNPLLISMSVNGASDYNAVLGENLNYVITFKNTFDIALADIAIVAKLDSPLFDLKTVKTDGFFSSKDRTITWHRGNTPQLHLLNPNESGLVRFSVALLPQAPPDAKEETIKVSAEISSPTKPKYLGLEALVSATTEFIAKLKGEVVLERKVLFRDPEATFVNTGPLPLRVNQQTQFSVHIKVKAIRNNFENLLIETTLPEGVTFAGNTSGNISGTQFLASPRSGQISWEIPKLSAYESREVIFQINVIPNIQRAGIAGYPMKLLDLITLTGRDSFTATDFSTKTEPAFSDLPDDPTVDHSQGGVLP